MSIKPEIGLSMGQVGLGQVRVLELYNGLGLVGLSSMIAWVRSGLEVYAGKPGWVAGIPHFIVRKFAKVYEG